MSSSLCNPNFLEHLELSKVQMKSQMYFETDRMIDPVYSQVLADLHKFFTFDDGLVRQREGNSEPPVLSPCTIMQQHNQSSNNTPPDVTTAPNVSQNGDHQFDGFQNSILQSNVPFNNQSPNNSDPTPLEPLQSKEPITHSSSLPNVKDEIVSDSEDYPIEYEDDHPVGGHERGQPVNGGLNVDPKIEFDDYEDKEEEECECKDCLNDFNQLHNQSTSDEQPNDTEQDQSTSREKENDKLEVDQETCDELGREIKEEMHERDNRESILAPTDILNSRNAFDSFHPTENEHIRKSNDGHSNQQKVDESSQYAEAHNLDESEEMFGLAVKKPRMESAQPLNDILQDTGHSSRIETQNPTQSAQLHNAITNEKKILTLSVQCLESGCVRVFAQKVQLNLHMWNDHSISLFSCVVKDCRQSFDTRDILCDHIKDAHRHTSQWQCDKCHKNEPTYQQLSIHNIDHHQFGLFQCSFLSCTFTGECRMKVYHHYTNYHQPSGKYRPTLNCQHPACSFETLKPSILKTHHRAHLGIKPYRCKWSQCDYASVQKAKTIGDIRGKHLAPNPGSVPNGAQLDPKDYLEVIHELL